MFYHCKRSDKKIIHTVNCFHIQRTPIEQIDWFESLAIAYREGYVLCKHCNPVFRYYERQEQEITDFCARNGLSVRLWGQCIEVTTPRSLWKIVINSEQRLTLYHENTYTSKEDPACRFRGFHLQGDVSKDCVTDYLDYIVEHDYFRMLNPVRPPKKLPTPPKKGTKRYKSEQVKQKKRERSRAIKNVLHLINALNTPQATAAV